MICLAANKISLEIRTTEFTNLRGVEGSAAPLVNELASAYLRQRVMRQEV